MLRSFLFFIHLSFSHNFVGDGVSKRLGMGPLIFSHKMLYIFVCVFYTVFFFFALEMGA